MSPVESIQLLVSVNLIIIGLSHFLQVRIWIEFFEFLSAKGHAGNIVNAMMSLALGSLIVSFHFVWSWPLILVTLYGLSQLIKAFVYLIFPEVGLKSIGKVNVASSKFKWVGLIMFAAGMLLFFSLLSKDTFA